MGERTPHLDPHGARRLVGLTAAHRRAHLTRSVMEGVAYSLRDCLDILVGMGVPVDEIRASGGGARSPLWRQIQADVFGETVPIVAAEEAGLRRGAAGRRGRGPLGQRAEACDAVVRVVTRMNPNPVNQATMARQYERFKALYPALKAVR